MSGGRDAFVVNVATLGREGHRHVQRRGSLPGLMVSASRVPEASDVGIDVEVEAVSGGVMVSGTIEADWLGECRRCLGPATGHLTTAVRELYEPGSDGEETYPLEGDRLDLAPLARDAVLLELPQAALCGEQCRGLCPTCGADLNQGDCGCPPAGGDPRWAALDVLRGDD